MKAIVVDVPYRTIYISSAFAKRAFTHGTEEYRQLMSARADFPDFRLETRVFKTNTKQDRHRGLTYNFMRDYISAHEKDDKDSVLAVFEEMVGISKGHSLSKRYPTIKAWFLKRYPKYAEFGMTEEELTKWHAKQEDAAKNAAPENSAPPAESKVIKMHEASESEEDLAPAANA